MPPISQKLFICQGFSRVCTQKQLRKGNVKSEANKDFIFFSNMNKKLDSED